MRLVLVAGLLLGSSTFAFAQPVPPPAPEPTTQEGSSLSLRAGIGFGRYGESGAGWKWESELQPYALVGAEGVFPRAAVTSCCKGKPGSAAMRT